MKWGLLAGWGIAIYAVVFLAWNILVIHGIIDGVVGRSAPLLVLIAMLAIAARNLSIRHWYEMLPYSLGWALIAAGLDVVCTVPVSGWAVWRDWGIWVGYALVMLVPPLLCVYGIAQSRKKTHSARV